MVRFLILAVMFLSAFLLFIVQPLYAKYLLPYFGGTSSVWTISVFFYSMVLLVGYLYATFLIRVKTQRVWLLHAALLFAACVLLLVRTVATGSPLLIDTISTSAPALSVLLTLLAGVAFPVVLLSSTSVIAQSLYARYTNKEPYQLFVVSNAGSLIGLLAYPFVLEPFSPLALQSFIWMGGFVVFSIGLVSVWVLLNRATLTAEKPISTISAPLQHKAAILVMSAIPTFLLASMTEFLSKGIASFPLLWIIPLALYLISFIVAFQDRVTSRRLPLELTTFLGLLLLLTLIPFLSSSTFIYWCVFLYAMAVYFLLSVYFHKKVYQLRPGVADLGPFYVLLTVGGALGSGVVGLLFPIILNDTLELHVALCVLLLYFLIRQTEWLKRKVDKISVGIVRGATIALVVAYVMKFSFPFDLVAHGRNFYGAVRIVESKQVVDGVSRLVRMEINGNTHHGVEVQDLEYQGGVGSYYGYGSGVEIALRSFVDLGHAPRVSVIGLGTGMVSAYCEQAESISYIEINPMVVDFARQYFSYLKTCSTESPVTVGDGRLVLEAAAGEGQDKFDVIVVDAFTDDAVPSHLLTTEAFMRAYQPLLTKQGIVAFHVTNRYLDLKPPIAGMARAAGYEAVIVENIPDNSDSLQTVSHWVLVTTKEQAARLLTYENVLPYTGKTIVWTDDRNTILSALSLEGSWEK